MDRYTGGRCCRVPPLGHCQIGRKTVRRGCCRRWCAEMQRNYSEDQEKPLRAIGHSKTESLTIANRRERTRRKGEPCSSMPMAAPDVMKFCGRDEADVTEKLVRVLSKVAEMPRSVVIERCRRFCRWRRDGAGANGMELGRRMRSGSTETTSNRFPHRAFLHRIIRDGACRMRTGRWIANRK